MTAAARTLQEKVFFFFFFSVFFFCRGVSNILTPLLQERVIATLQQQANQHSSERTQAGARLVEQATKISQLESDLAVMTRETQLIQAEYSRTEELRATYEASMQEYAAKVCVLLLIALPFAQLFLERFLRWKSSSSSAIWKWET